jgi:hypothetical protein
MILVSFADRNLLFGIFCWLGALARGQGMAQRVAACDFDRRGAELLILLGLWGAGRFAPQIGNAMGEEIMPGFFPNRSTLAPQKLLDDFSNRRTNFALPRFENFRRLVAYWGVVYQFFRFDSG